MTQLPIHTPYDGSSKLFQIGLKQLDLRELDRDRRDVRFPAWPRSGAFTRNITDKVFVAEPGTEDAQAEVLALLTEHLPVRFPERYRKEGNRLTVTGHPELDGLEARDLPSLHEASSSSRKT